VGQFEMTSEMVLHVSCNPSEDKMMEKLDKSHTYCPFKQARIDVMRECFVSRTPQNGFYGITENLNELRESVYV
jgi:hypothetical protein